MSSPSPLASLLLTVTVAVASLAACTSAVIDVPASPPRPTPDARPLLTIEWRGGLCPAGLCERTLEIDGDGSVRDPGPRGARLGVIAPATVQRLAAEIRRADFREIASHPFVGTCPMAYDGQEAVYTFHRSTGPVAIASCTVAINAHDPLFRAVDAALAAMPAVP